MANYVDMTREEVLLVQKELARISWASLPNSYGLGILIGVFVCLKTDETWNANWWQAVGVAFVLYIVFGMIALLRGRHLRGRLRKDIIHREKVPHHLVVSSKNWGKKGTYYIYTSVYKRPYKVSKSSFNTAQPGQLMKVWKSRYAGFIFPF